MDSALPRNPKFEAPRAKQSGWLLAPGSWPKESKERRAKSKEPGPCTTAFLATMMILLSWAPLWAQERFWSSAPIAVEPFSLTERSGKTVTRDDLLGKIWVAHFFFGSCLGGCSQTTVHVAELHKKFAGYANVSFVSITVDPLRDTPAELRTYADRFDADPARWLFLTGSSEAEVHAIIQKSFFQAIAPSKKQEQGFQWDHTFRLLLIDPQGNLVGYIDDARDPAQVALLERGLRDLLRRTRLLPGVNAALNSLCTILLLLGYAAIRRRRERLHKTCMLTALAVSAVFLTSYLYHHLVVMGGQATRFTGQGLVRPLYFGILLSHTVLAVVAAPLALLTAYQGLRDHRPRHIRLARWTLPIWLYVSVTGVAVYLMLYQLF